MEETKMPEADGQMLEFEQRAGIRNLTSAEASDFWSGKELIFFQKEKVKIIEKLEKEANEITNKCKEEGKTILYEDEIEKNEWRELKNKIINTYCRYSYDGRFENFIKKTLKKSYNLGTHFFVLFIIAIILEFVVLLFQSVGMALTEGEDLDVTVIGMAFFYAVLLAIGGVLLGKGLGKWFASKEMKDEGISDVSTFKMNMSDYVFIVIGMVLIIAISIIRTIAGGGLQALFITLLLGILIATLEGIRVRFNLMRSFIAKYREAYFLYLASNEHLKNLNYYKNEFLSKIRKFANEKGIKYQSKEA